MSPVPVLTPAVAAAVRAVADRYAGTFADVLRAAVPPRHARAEAAVMSAAASPPSAPDAPTGPGPWSGYQGGEALCDRLAGRVPGPGTARGLDRRAR